MKIFFDARWTRLDTHDGISRYGSSLVTALAKLHPVTMIIYDERQLRLLPQGVPHIKLNHPFSPVELLVARKLNKLGADVVFSPLQTMGTWGRKYKLILTLQDLTYYKFAKPPAHLPALVRFIWWLFHKAYWPQKLLLGMADHIATVSKTSKREIEELRLTKLPITVVYNAPTKLADKVPPNNPQKELVYMGSFMPYKNTELLMRAMNLLPDYHLHMLSRIAPSREAELKALTKHADHVTFWHGTSDEKYVELLARATASVTVSKAEGFGLQIIEAMNQGVPVVCTDMPIFREVGGTAALYIDPDSPQAFATAVRQLENSATWRERSEMARAQASKFTWENSAKTLLTVMQDLVQADLPHRTNGQ